MKISSPPIDTTVLDGVRLLFNCAVVCFHAYIFKVEYLTDTKDPIPFLAFGKSNFLSILTRQGTSWVDVFFLLNSFLLVYNLLPRLEEANKSAGGVWSVLVDFYFKKWYTIVPIYTASTIMTWAIFYLIRMQAHLPFSLHDYSSNNDVMSFFVGGGPERVWKNLLLINNWGPDFGCGAFNWTMAPTILCYLIAPLLLVLCRPGHKDFIRRFITLASVMFVGGLLVNVYLTVASGIRYPMPMFASIQGDMLRFIVYFYNYYICSLPRVPVLVVGAMMGLLLRRPAAITWLRAHLTFLSGVAALLLSAFYVNMMTWQTTESTFPWSESVSVMVNVLCNSGSPLHAFTFAAVMLALIFRAPLFEPFVWILNQPVVRSLSAYSHGLHFFQLGGIYLAMEILEHLHLVDAFKNDKTYYLSMIAFNMLVLALTGTIAHAYSHVVEPRLFGLARGLLKVF